MTHTQIHNPLALSTALTAKTLQLCQGLACGAADILERVTPTTAELLLWWFGEEMVTARGGSVPNGGGLNFHAGQKQAILNAIVAHEVLSLDAPHWSLLDLYKAVAPDALLAGNQLAEVAQDKHGHPKYCFKMATGTGKTWVLQALMIWQLLNKSAALAQGLDDARFTRFFLVVAPGLIVYERLLDAFCGKPIDGASGGGGGSSRDFATSDLAQFADLFVPESQRETVFAFVRGNACNKSEIGLKATGGGMIAITNWHLLTEGDAADEAIDVDSVDAPGVPLPAHQIVNAVLPLTFKAERDDSGQPTLSEGQRVMLRAGLKKLRKLEADFARLDPRRHPKMLVVCEDTGVSPCVAEFLKDQEGLRYEGDIDDDILLIDSGKKAELGEKDWAPLRQRLFAVDRHATPRVIVSVLMLREGFDVNNICVIVPLRSSQAQILLEQTIGRGLRLMWRDPEYTDLKRENRERINAGQEPGSLLDVLSIVEHPAFQSFYDDLLAEGLAGTTGDDTDNTSATGDVLAAELRDGYAAFDFGIPFIVQEADEAYTHKVLPAHDLPAFTAMNIDSLKGLLGQGDTFVSQDLQSATLFGDYRVSGAVMNVGGYNDYLSRLTRRISQALSAPLSKGNKIAIHQATPYLQINTAELTGALDDYIWMQLFGQAFNPLADENWRLLLLKPVVDHITKVFAVALLDAGQQHSIGQTEVHPRYLSEVPRLLLRESHSVAVSKCIYTRLGWPAHNGGLEKALIHWAQANAQVLAFCKISETRHSFARLRYVKDDGLAAFYSPDFLLRTADAIYLAETKAQAQTIHPNVQRKRRAALAWCERINTLAAVHRSGLPWHYVLMGEDVVYEWQAKGAHLAELLHFARLRPQSNATLQQSLI